MWPGSGVTRPGFGPKRGPACRRGRDSSRNRADGRRRGGNNRADSWTRATGVGIWPNRGGTRLIDATQPGKWHDGKAVQAELQRQGPTGRATPIGLGRKLSPSILLVSHRRNTAPRPGRAGRDLLIAERSNRVRGSDERVRVERRWGYDRERRRRLRGNHHGRRLRRHDGACPRPGHHDRDGDQQSRQYSGECPQNEIHPTNHGLRLPRIEPSRHSGPPHRLSTTRT
jgi:hypothetical protein